MPTRQVLGESAKRRCTAIVRRVLVRRRVGSAARFGCQVRLNQPNSIYSLG
jgi:hypothetical protein